MTHLIEKAQFNDVYKELQELFELHWDELGQPGYDDEFLLDLDTYKAYSEAGLHRGFVVRDDENNIIGYLGCFVHNALHNAMSLVATTDAIYVHPAYRKGSLGIKLIKFAEHSIKEEGIKYFQLATNMNYDLTSLCERLGYQASSLIFTKDLSK